MSPKAVISPQDALEEGLHEAVCKEISYEYPHAADIDDVVFYERQGCPPIVVAYFSITSDGKKKPQVLFRKYDPLTLEGRSALQELTRSLLGKPFNGLIDLSGLKGRFCTLVIVHREVNEVTYPSILTVIPRLRHLEEPFAW